MCCTLSGWATTLLIIFACCAAITLAAEKDVATTTADKSGGNNAESTGTVETEAEPKILPGVTYESLKKALETCKKTVVDDNQTKGKDVNPQGIKDMRKVIEDGIEEHFSCGWWTRKKDIINRVATPSKGKFDPTWFTDCMHEQIKALDGFNDAEFDNFFGDKTDKSKRAFKDMIRGLSCPSKIDPLSQHPYEELRKLPHGIIDKIGEFFRNTKAYLACFGACLWKEECNLLQVFGCLPDDKVYYQKAAKCANEKGAAGVVDPQWKITFPEKEVEEAYYKKTGIKRFLKEPMWLRTMLAGVHKYFVCGIARMTVESEDASKDVKQEANVEANPPPEIPKSRRKRELKGGFLVGIFMLCGVLVGGLTAGKAGCLSGFGIGGLPTIVVGALFGALTGIAFGLICFNIGQVVRAVGKLFSG